MVNIHACSKLLCIHQHTHTHLNISSTIYNTVLIASFQNARPVIYPTYSCGAWLSSTVTGELRRNIFVYQHVLVLVVFFFFIISPFLCVTTRKYATWKNSKKKIATKIDVRGIIWAEGFWCGSSAYMRGLWINAPF